MLLEESKALIGKNISFAAAEAYKLLRTNLNFSLATSSNCKVIGVTSSIKGEGKSTTSINLAYTMAQSGGRVLLIEADMRLPNIARRLNLRSKPGLSNYLANQCSGNDIIQHSNFLPNLWVITAGDIPPNPSELLDSERMRDTLSALMEIFDNIIVDLPPVNIVTDAALVSKYVDGILLVVRQNYCNRRALDEAVQQLSFANAKILGFVMTGANTQKKSYSRYGNNSYYGDYRRTTASAK